MRNLFTNKLLILSLALVFVQCNKTPELEVRAPYAELTLDPDGGQWKTYLEYQPELLQVPAPAGPTSVDYFEELQSLKSVLATVTEEQRQAALYWGGNGVLRWHEIAREIAADYNVPPNNKEDGTYPAPDPMNPTVYPRFPFANPPYAARAFALLAVAQYDALVAVWEAKYEHNRLSPSSYDKNIVSLLPFNSLPSYPSEDAAVAVASRELMKFLFPGEVQYLEGRASEHIDSRLWAGANVQSDLDAGAAIGLAVAQKVIAYAKTDNMSKANNQSLYPTLIADANSRGFQATWTSRDNPARPPMLPFYGGVKTWNFGEAEKVAIRPPAPPLPGTPGFQADLQEVLDLSKNRSREQLRIASFWADGPGTYTPPGHWNRRAADLIHRYELNEIRSARTMALVSTALQDAGISCWDTKYYYLTQRPSEVDPAVKTCTGIPNFPGYTSGHSTFSGAAAEVLAYLFPNDAEALQQFAKEASDSRIFGCIHFRVDCEQGLEAGKRVGQYAILRAKNDGAE